MGVVYKARQISLNRIVALKMLLTESYSGKKERARFQAKAEAAARLQHPHIVQIHEFGQTRNCPYLALEFVDGGTLAQRLASTPQPARLSAHLVELIACAILMAHEYGIVHRDLKPGNILLSESLGPAKK